MVNAGNNTLIRLPRSLNGAYLPDLSEALEANRGEAVALDAEEVEHLGGLCLQMLISAWKTWQSEDHSFEILNPSEGFSRDLRLLGCEIGFFNGQEMPA